MGVLKDWLMRTLTGVSRRNANVLNIGDLQAHALSVSQCDKMLAEASEGEVSLCESAEERGSAANSTRLEPAGRQVGAFGGQSGGVGDRSSAAAQAAQETGTTSAHA